LIDDVSHLLLRMGVLSRIKRVRKAGYRDGWQLFINGAENQLRFLRHVGVHGAKDAAAEALISKLELVRRNTNLDTIPKSVWSDVRAAMAGKSMTQREFAAAMNTKFCGAAMWKPSPSRGRLHRVAVILEDRQLHDLATSDVFWDEIAEITSLGEQDVYDVTAAGSNDLIAQGIAVLADESIQPTHAIATKPETVVPK
jgi:intein/homing endonuclease